MTNDGGSLQERLPCRSPRERLGEEVACAHDLIVYAEHVLFNRLSALRTGVLEQIANNTVIAIEGLVEAVKPLFFLGVGSKLLASHDEAETVHLCDVLGVIANIPCAQDQHAGVSKPIHKECCRDHDYEDADCHGTLTIVNITYAMLIDPLLLCRQFLKITIVFGEVQVTYRTRKSKL
jgi:hypothetical protein